MPLEMEYTETLTVTHCWCGIALGVPSNLYSHAKKHKGTTIYCPIGHQFLYSNTTEEQLAEAKAQVERERQRVRATRDLLEAEERSHTATKGHLTRQRKRASAGVCPCCNRSFPNVARHMATKHPNFAA